MPWLHLICGTLLVATLGAQAQLTTIGRFVDPGGAPVAGAEVTFATSPIRVYDAFAPTTIVTAVTDAEGRFRAPLAVGKAHSCWAVGPKRTGGPVRSEVLEGVIAGSVIEIRGSAPTRRDERAALHVGEIASLGDGPFSAMVRIDARHGPAYTLPITADGTIELPPLPAGQLHLRILDRGGKIIVPSPALAGDRVAWGQPRRRRFVVRDEHGKPLAGARVGLWSPEFIGHGQEPFEQLRTANAWMVSPPTDAQGNAELTVRGAGPVFVAWTEGRALSVTGHLNGTWIQDGEMLEQSPYQPGEFPDEIEFTLRGTPALRGRLRRGERSLAGVGIQLATEIRMSRNGASTWFDHAVTTRTDAEGRFAFASIPRQASGLQLALASLAPDAPPVLLLPREETPQQPLDLDLATWPVVTMQLLDRNGGPPKAGQLVLLPGHTRLPDPDLVVLHTDRAGRVRAQLEPGTWFLFATDGDGYAVRLVTIEPGPTADFALPLTALSRCAGTLVDADGNPVPDRGFQFNGRKGSSTPADATELELLLRHHSMRLNHGLTRGARTAADGSFELRFLPVEGVLLIGAPAGMSSARLELRTATDLELREKR